MVAVGDQDAFWHDEGLDTVTRNATVRAQGPEPFHAAQGKLRLCQNCAAEG
jgi:hypothetical protein